MGYCLIMLTVWALIGVSDMKYAFPCVCVAGAVILKACGVDGHGYLVGIGCFTFAIVWSADK